MEQGGKESKINGPEAGSSGLSVHSLLFLYTNPQSVRRPEVK